MKEVLYFSHDANALTDTKILNMRADYGLEGYGLFWAIVEQLRCEENYSLPRNKNTFRAIKINTNTTIDVEKFVNDCINEYELFEASEDGESFYSCSLKRRMTIKDEKKMRRSAAGKKGAEKRWNENNNSSENSNAIKNDSNAIEENSNAITMSSKKMANDGKGKESKVKEKKVKKIININKTKLNETFNLIINNNTQKIAEENQMSKSEVLGFFNVLNRLELIMQKEILNILMPKEVQRYKFSAYAILELYKSSYKVYLGQLDRLTLIHKFEKTKEYFGDADEDDKNNLNGFMSYFIRCIQDELENSE